MLPQEGARIFDIEQRYSELVQFGLLRADTEVCGLLSDAGFFSLHEVRKILPMTLWGTASVTDIENNGWEIHFFYVSSYINEEKLCFIASKNYIEWESSQLSGNIRMIFPYF